MSSRYFLFIFFVFCVFFALFLFILFFLKLTDGLTIKIGSLIEIENIAVWRQKFNYAFWDTFTDRNDGMYIDLRNFQFFINLRFSADFDGNNYCNSTDSVDNLETALARMLSIDNYKTVQLWCDTDNNAINVTLTYDDVSFLTQIGDDWVNGDTNITDFENEIETDLNVENVNYISDSLFEYTS